MKRIALTTAAALMIATSASAGGFSFSLPSLTYPPATQTTVAKDCLQTPGAATTCAAQE